MIYSAQATQPKESDQLRLERHQGLSARSPVARFDEVIYSAQATQPNESDQFRLERHKGLSARSPVARFDEVIYSAQATQPNESNQLRLERHQGLSARSPVALFDELCLNRPCILGISSACANQPREPQRLSLKSLTAQLGHSIQAIRFMKKSAKGTSRNTNDKKKCIFIKGKATCVFSPRADKKQVYMKRKV